MISTPADVEKKTCLGNLSFPLSFIRIVHSQPQPWSFQTFFASLFLANFPLPTPPHKCIRPSWASYSGGGVATNRHQERGRPAASPSLSHCNGWCSPRRDSAKSPPPVFSGRGGGEGVRFFARDVLHFGSVVGRIFFLSRRRGWEMRRGISSPDPRATPPFLEIGRVVFKSPKLLIRIV